MFKAIAFIIAVGLVLNGLGMAFHGPILGVEGQVLSGFAGGLLAAAAALVALFMAMALFGALFMGLVVMAIGLPLFLVAVLVCALLAPVLIPVLALFAVGLMLVSCFGAWVA